MIHYCYCTCLFVSLCGTIKCPNCGSIFEEDDFPTNCPMCDCKINDTFRQDIQEKNNHSQDSSSWSCLGKFILLIIILIIILIIELNSF